MLACPISFIKHCYINMSEHQSVDDAEQICVPWSLPSAWRLCFMRAAQVPTERR